MLRDITIGQHFPGSSAVHQLDPRIKIVLSIAYIVVLYVGQSPVAICLAILFLLVAYGLSKIPAKTVLRSIKPLIPLLIITTVLNLFITKGEPVFVWGPLSISWEGIYAAVIFSVRLVCLLVGMGLLTYTTSPIVLTDAIERLLSPLARFHFPAHELAMMMTIALRFIPVLIEETDKIMSAQKARGANLDSGNLMQRVKALIPVLIPLFLSALRRAEELAMAMECRCYHGGDGRTRLRQLKITQKDVATTAACAAFFAAIALANIFLPIRFS